MTQLQDDMKHTIAALQTQHGITADQATAISNAAVAPVLAKLNDVVNAEAADEGNQKSDEKTLADVKATLQELNAAFAPATPAAPANPAPDAAPATGGDSTANAGNTATEA